MKQINKFSLFLVFLLALPFTKVFGNGSITTESVLTIKDLEVHHQGINRLNIKLTVRYTPDAKDNQQIGLSGLNRSIDSVLAHYPNTTDWWEIVNKNLTSFIMQKYGVIDSLASDIEVSWVSGAGVEYGHRYPTRCVTARTRSGNLYEYFGFRTLPDYSLSFLDKGLNKVPVYLDVLYQYKKGITNTEYPDGLATENTFKNKLQAEASKNPGKLVFWDGLNQVACQELLNTYEPIVAVMALVSPNPGSIEKVGYMLKIKR